ncbi:hypothetical protein [Candidatus Spongiihabitans sp.]|uniref:hypothetical protein n=1 Tax=Candidatus Spongiihabitans sp. TaxID=3101308 RepID=UPI003C6FB8FB
MSRSQIDLDYTNTGDGDYESDLTSVHPYLGWTAGRLDLWATVGYGEGDLEITDDVQRRLTSDSETGRDLNLGAGVRCANPVTGLTLEGKVRTLVGRADYEEWGIQGLISLDAGADGQGLSMSLKPGYGDTASEVQRIWGQGVLDYADKDADRTYGMRLDTRIGYGFGFTLRDRHGVLMPYGELTLGATDSYRMGLNWKAGSRFDLTLLGERREHSSDPAEHAILLKGEVRF